LPDLSHESEATTRRLRVDKALHEAGWWPIVDYSKETKYQNGAVREYPTLEGPADYILFQKGTAVASVEAKKLTLGPQNVLGQAQRYARGFRDGEFEFGEYHLPFAYSTNGDVIWFREKQTTG